MFIFIRKGIYYVEYFDEVQQKTKRVSTKKKTKAEATKFVSELRYQIKDRLKPQGISLSQFRAEYEERAEISYSAKYIKSIKLSFKMFTEFIGDPNLNLITIRDVDGFVSMSYRRAETAAHLYHRTLKAAFNKAVDWEYIEFNPFTKVKPPKLIKKFPSVINHSELQKILEQVENAVLGNLYHVAYYTGMRQSELLNLKWDSIDLKNNILTVKNSTEFKTKSKKDRQIPISKTIIKTFAILHKVKKSDYVFPNEQGYKFHQDTISHRFKDAVRAAGMSEDIHFHSLRHSFASNLVRNGTSLYVVKELLGHTDISTTQIYSHLNVESLHDAILKL
ncbi:MAG: tyrosine-type recombinase/integrase [Melioribacteraceae bacterium]|nr:tyrosine-type recombinase/integrase [Melioribacteraceae bacterium]